MFVQPDDIGAEQVSVTLSRDMWVFICAGLRDLAGMQAGQLVDGDLDGDALAEENLEVASMIEGQLS